LQIKKEIPPNPRFKLAIERAHELLVEIEAEKLPINTDDVFDAYPNIVLIPYTEFKQNYDVVPDEYNFDKINAQIDKLNAAEPNPEKHRERLEALVRNIIGTNKFFIYFDDRIKNKPRIRWSIGHEIGHVFLEHFEIIKDAVINHSKLTEDEYWLLETEAHWFACELFAPSPVLLMLDKRLSASQISLLCDISSKAAIKKNRQLNKNYSYSENRRLMINFSQFMFSKSYLESLYTVMQKRIEAAPKLFWLLYSVCRICSKCGAFINDSGYSHCHWCGERQETPVRIGLASLPSDMPHARDGVVYEYFEESEKHRVLYCPKCKNYFFLSGDEFCKTCQTPLYNHCIEEKKLLPAECRRCPFCGGITDYSDLYDALKNQKIPPPARYRDFHKFEDWGYIRYMLRKKMSFTKGMYLYSILSDSVVYTDWDHFILIFTGDIGHVQNLLKNMQVIVGFIETYASAFVKETILYHFDREKREIHLIVPNE